MKYFILCLMSALLASCAPSDGRDGANGADGEPGTPGQDGSAAELLITLQPSRTYSPSTFTPKALNVSPGVMLIPSEATLVAGAAGTGWVSLVVGERRHCYQGNGANNSDIGTKFVLKGFKHVSGDCSTGGLTLHDDDDLTPVLFQETSVQAHFNGGGVVSGLQIPSSVSFNVRMFVF